MDILDLLEVLAYFALFWLFLFSPDFRRRQIAGFRDAGIFARCARLFHGAIATACGLLPVAVLGPIFLA